MHVVVCFLYVSDMAKITLFGRIMLRKFMFLNIY